MAKIMGTENIKPKHQTQSQYSTQVHTCARAYVRNSVMEMGMSTATDAVALIC